ncbi:hypothetical protein PIROE2DRAFT_10378 [Piromyces sp. E2]|nr:hypothetical protein PIROE2DRAFT_10378 [Piromyces sp. E2]|eukprot:OUM63159.1 hypothetical protein PIROE2DRAFT_10378 [Piromyces sp. E2]
MSTIIKDDIERTACNKIHVKYSRMFIWNIYFKNQRKSFFFKRYYQKYGYRVISLGSSATLNDILYTTFSSIARKMELKRGETNFSSI